MIEAKCSYLHGCSLHPAKCVQIRGEAFLNTGKLGVGFSMQPSEPSAHDGPGEGRLPIKHHRKTYCDTTLIREALADHFLG